ncbi:hypothetical protein ACE1SV_12110 [Streptomyces sp. E-15]
MRRVVPATAATVSGVVLPLSLKPASDPASASAGAAPGRTAAGREAPRGGARAAAGSGTLTGDAVATRYGAVQVRITVSGGRITAAEAVRAPSGGLGDRGTRTAVPELGRAAVAAQSADIATVSGAACTSEGYRRSLQSALDRADG